MRVIGYCRVSTAEQANSGAGLEAQRRAIVEECSRRGWELVAVLEDAGFSARDMKRPAVQEALRVLEAGEASGLVVAKFDRLSRSMIDFTRVMGLAQAQGWALTALDCNVDTSTPGGEALANVLAVFAQLERRLIGQRTREALEVKKRQGVRLGRPRTLPEEVRERIVAARREGRSYPEIANTLNAENVATAQGGKSWHPSTVRKIALAG